MTEPTADDRRLVGIPLLDTRLLDQPLGVPPTLDAICEHPERGAQLPRAVAVGLYVRAITVLQALTPAHPVLNRVAATVQLDPYLGLKALAGYAGVSVRQLRKYAERSTSTDG
jgi:hypothetical protein